MENRALKKIIVFMTVFMLVFSNCGYTLQALAATDGISLFGFNFLGSGNIDFDVYFLDQDGNKQTENISDVNNQMTMVLEFNPKSAGYLRSGTIKAISEDDGETNFKFEEVYVDNNVEAENLTINTQAETTFLQSENSIDAGEEEKSDETNIETEVSDNNADEAGDKLSEETETNIEEKGAEETETNIEEKGAEETEVNAEETGAEETEANVEETGTEETEANAEETGAEETEANAEENEPEEEVLVDEEAVLNEEMVSLETSLNSLAKATIVSENEIEIKSVIENTKVYVTLGFKTKENLNIKDLYKEIKFEFVGTYINVDLEEIPVSVSENVNIGWNYTKDIEVSSEYTKVSPFKIGEKEGTIVENTIIVKRDITDENYLPLKQTKMTLNIPDLAGNLPTDLDVSALKLKATTGEDTNEVTFSRENWEFDSNENTLIITVENKDGKFTYGEDIYVVTYRYDTYIEDAEVSLLASGTVQVTEFSAKDNNIVIKDLEKNEKVIANIGELITYSIGTTEEKICKGIINANYNQEEEKYETEFDTTVSVNILTNDVLNEFTLKDTKEFYIDKEDLEFETNDVKYKKIKLRYHEIEEFLSQGGSIEIKNSNGELLYTFNKDLIKSQDDAEISIQGDVRGVEISFKNIRVNGNITIEFVKAIGKSSFDKTAFANFKKLESRINAVVKYSENSTGTELSGIKAEKEFEESKTEAEIIMNKASLSTTEINKNVEFRIELNNDKINSDLYINPVFEIVFPKYVTNIDLKAVNILYESGLSIGNTTTYRAEDGTLRMRIEVNGIQTQFSEGEITNGTNIIVNANIELDKYAPRKDEQVKLYYINSGVTNYASQTKWTLGINVPDGILKTTNGFDSHVFKINAPSGFIAINEIQNYDGQNSIVTSIKQGEETREIEMGKSAQVAKMNLIAINNTENPCTDVTFLGRVPGQGITDIKTGEILSTNINVTMLNGITESDENPISAKYYYSANPNADKNLNDSSNGWTENVEEISNVKSFLIVPEGTVEASNVFKFTYEFMIPENLPYEAKIYGAFGAFYNNNSDVAITYEATTADLVGIITKSGPKVEATLTVNVGDGANVPEASFLDYTITVANSGSIAAEGVNVTNSIPTATKVYTETIIDGIQNYGWFEKNDQSDLVWTIDRLEPGEVRTFTYTLKTTKNPTMEEFTITNKAIVHVDNLALDIESNETHNKLTKSSFDINTYSKMNDTVSVKEKFEFAAEVKNISGEDMENITLVYKLPEEIMFTSYAANFSDGLVDLTNAEYTYESENNVFILKIPEWKNDQTLLLTVFTDIVAGNNEKVQNVLNFIKADGTSQSSKPLEILVKGPKLEASQVVSTLDNTIKEGETVEFIVSIQNNGNKDAEDTSLYSIISENLENVTINTSGSSIGDIGLTNSNELVSIIHSIPEGECLNIHISGKAVDVDDDTKTISSKMLISNQYTKDISTNEIVLQILNNPNKVVEEPAIEDDNTVINPGNSEGNSEETYDSSIYVEPSNNEETNNNLDNNIPTNTVQLENSEKNDKNNTLNTEEEQNISKYNISGKIWLDTNKNGILEDDENGLSGIQVQLQKDNINIKATVSPRDGSYTFRDLEPGRYVIIYTFDDLYTATVYKNAEAGIERASYARDLSNGKAITDTITVGSGNVKNINLGLQNRDSFDLSIAKYITLAKVTTKGKTIEHKYNNLDLAKLEISAKDLSKTTVELHYHIVVKNEGNVSGRAIQIVDYLPKDTVLNKEQSANWYLGSDGNVYNDSLSEFVIEPGETRTLNLVLNRTMTAENTGVLGNKVVITKQDGELVNTSNDDATQELIISVKTGYTVPIIINVIVVACSVAIIYLEKTQKIIIDFKKLKIKRIYK